MDNYFVRCFGVMHSGELMYTYVTTLFKLLLLAIVFFLLGTFLGLVCACDFKQLKQESACFALDDREACKQAELREQTIKSAMSSGGWNDRNLARQDLDESGRNWKSRNTQLPPCEKEYLQCVSNKFLAMWGDGEWRTKTFITKPEGIKDACQECLSDCLNMVEQGICNPVFWADYVYNKSKNSLPFGAIVMCKGDDFE